MALSLHRYTCSSDIDSRVNRFMKARCEKEREMSMGISVVTENGNRLPENLISEILLWLPVKELLQYKTVCKAWHAIISSPHFVSKHLKNTRKTNDNCLLAQYYTSNPFELQLFELLVDDSPRVLAYEVLYSMPMYGSHICGPCDGLYYLYECGIDSGPRHLWNPSRALWNPALNELRALPPMISKPDPPTNTTYANSEDYGFGLDRGTGDYKVVVIKGYRSSNHKDVECPKSVFVYSLTSDSWKYCGDLSKNYILAKNTSYIFAKGCCFWLGTISCGYGYDDVIISFDMASDSFQEINVPDYMYQKPGNRSLGIYDDSLAYFTVFMHEFEIWTLSKQRIWSNKFPAQDFGAIHHVVGYWKDDKLLVETQSGKVVLYDLVAQNVKDLFFKRDGQWCQGMFAYMESLVSIKDKKK